MEQFDNEQLEESGRGGDDSIGHLTAGEIVIPLELQRDEDVIGMLQALFQQGGLNIAEFTVGDPANKINPETGYPEFFSIGKIFKKAAKLATSSFLPGKLGDTVEALTPVALNFVPGVGPALAAGYTGLKSYGDGNSLGSSLGSGLKTYTLGKIGAGIMGQAAGTPLSGASGPTEGSGIRGLLSGGSSGIGGALSGATGGGSSFAPLASASNIIGGIEQNSAIKKQQKQLLEANSAQQQNLESFDPSGITEDPGYEFNLEQGQQGLNRTLAAGGGLQSGAAIKAATEYNQKYAQNSFNDYYQRWLAKVNGQNALTGAAGDVRANATGAKSQNIAQSLSNAVSAPVGQYGQGLSLEEIRRLGMAV